MSEPSSSFPISILARLRNKAQAEGRNAQDLLRYYAIERFLYRLSQSPYADRFVLKGALIFLAWGIELPRPTRDIDLRGFVPDDLDEVCGMVRSICCQPVPADGMDFAPQSVKGEIVQEAARYQGLRITFEGTLGKARVRMQLDIGIADKITPSPLMVSYPTLLDMPVPELRGYPPETVVAEKVEAMVVLGEINSRMKDFYDVWLIAQRFELDGSLLQKAIHTTFGQRGTALPDSLPVALGDTFAVEKQEMWRAFVARSTLGSWAPTELTVVVNVLRAFLSPVLSPEVFKGHWSGELAWR